MSPVHRSSRWSRLEVCSCFLRRGLPLLVLFRELDDLATDGVVPPEWMADPVVGHEDAGQVGVVVEDDPKEVVGLALVPVRGRKEVVNRVDSRRVSSHEGADPQLFAVLEVAQLIDDLESGRPFTGRVGEVVDAGEERQESITVCSERGQSFSHALGWHCHPFIAGTDAAVDDQLLVNHWRGLMPWALMRSCRIIRALRRSSGRGGQPGMYTSTGTILSTP